MAPVRTQPVHSMRLAAILATIVAISLLLLPLRAASAGEDLTLKETGSTLIHPLFGVWASEYARTHPGVAITTASTGSGAGIEQAVSGAVQIGTSDSYMSDAEIRRHPEILNVALAISAQTVNYNVPGLNGTNLRLDGPTLAGIYSGKIHMWDDPPIAALNPGAKLPHNAIVPIRRSDGSGDTFIFTQYLSFTTPSWEDAVNYGTTVKWPHVTGGVDAPGTVEVLEALQHTPYSIGYAGVSYHDEIAKAGLGTAAVKSYDGEFLLPTPESITAAAASLGPRTPADERLTLVNAPGANCYPLINYEYAIVSTKQANPTVAAALRKFLLWAIAPDEANEKFLAEAHFIPLPAHIWVLSHDQIQMIK
jgi:phosphate transport system substrate-binding protein